jgi:hypothetical protein
VVGLTKPARSDLSLPECRISPDWRVEGSDHVPKKIVVRQADGVKEVGVIASAPVLRREVINVATDYSTDDARSCPQVGFEID